MKILFISRMILFCITPAKQITFEKWSKKAYLWQESHTGYSKYSRKSEIEDFPWQSNNWCQNSYLMNSHKSPLTFNLEKRDSVQALNDQRVATVVFQSFKVSKEKYNISKKVKLWPPQIVLPAMSKFSKIFCPCAISFQENSSRETLIAM